MFESIVQQQLPGVWPAIQLLLPHLWWIAICVAVFSYLMAQYYQRKVFPRVEFHRKGPNAETYRCLEVGNRVMFHTGGGFSLFKGKREKQMITATMMAKPEIKVFGFKTIRLHHVVEGNNQTVDIRDLVFANPELGGAALATSEAVMSTAFENMAKSIPKGKSEYIWMFITGMMGFGWGMLCGLLFV